MIGVIKGNTRSLDYGSYGLCHKSPYRRGPTFETSPHRLSFRAELAGQNTCPQLASQNGLRADAKSCFPDAVISHTLPSTADPVP